MQEDDETFATSKDHARSKYRFGRLPLFNNRTRGAHSCMVTVGHESRVCDVKGAWCPSHTSQAAHDAEVAARGAHGHRTGSAGHSTGAGATDGAGGVRRKSGSVSSDDGIAVTATSGGAGGDSVPAPRRSVESRSPSLSPPRMHYEKPHHRAQSKKESQRASKELSHHRDRIQRREDLATGQ